MRKFRVVTPSIVLGRLVGSKVRARGGRRWVALVAILAALPACVAQTTAPGEDGERVTTRGPLVASSASWKHLWTGSPSSFNTTAVVYDTDRHVEVLFGCRIPASSDGPAGVEVWEWNATTAEWRQRTPVGAAPPPRAFATVAYDPIQKRTMLVGGFGDTGQLLDQWDWDGSAGTWTLRTPAGATPRQLGHTTMAWDSDRQRIVLFGGWDGTYTDNGYNNQLWEWDGVTGTWSDRTPAGLKPTPRAAVTMAYDSVRKKMLVYGANFTVDETWEWDGATQTWTRGPAAGPRVVPGTDPNDTYNLVAEARMVFDASRAKMLLVFGGDAREQRLFEYAPTPAPAKWVEVAPANTTPYLSPYNGPATYDPVRNVVFDLSNGVWEYDGATNLWTPHTVAAPNSLGFAAAVDGKTGALSTFGGDQSGAGTQDFWEWSDAAGSWNERIAADPPPPGISAMVYDSKRDQMIVIPGAGNGLTGFNTVTDVWLWSPPTDAWTDVRTSGAIPGSLPQPAAFYDPARDKVILVGPQPAELDVATLVWTLRPADTTGLSVKLTTRSAYGLAYDTDRSKLLLVHGAYEPSPGPSHFSYVDGSIWEWDFLTGTYTERPPLAGQPAPTARKFPGVSYDSARHLLVMIGPDDSWEWDPVSGAWTETTSPGRPGVFGTDEVDRVVQLYDVKNARTLFFGNTASDGFGFRSLWEYRSNVMPPSRDGGAADGPDHASPDAGAGTGARGGGGGSIGGASGNGGGGSAGSPRGASGNGGGGGSIGGASGSGGGGGSIGGASGIGGGGGSIGGASATGGERGARSDGAVDGGRGNQDGAGCGCGVGGSQVRVGLATLWLTIALAFARRRRR